MRILITGGFGFVGGRVAAHLAQMGHQIILGSRGTRKPPLWLPRAEVIQLDWDNIQALAHICSGIDLVIHAAGMSAQECAKDPAAALAFNGVATARLVTAACQVNVGRLIYLSTAHVYSNPLVGTITEDSCPRNLHPYATSHLAGEYVVLGANQRAEIQGIVLRLSNTFGAPMSADVNCWSLLVNDLCKQAVQTGQLILHSNALQQRDFIDLQAVSEIIYYISLNHINTTNFGAVNVCSGKAKSLLQMAQLIQERSLAVLGIRPELHYPKINNSDQLVPLNIQTQILKQLKIDPNLSPTNEVDKLLRFCEAAFK